MTIQHKIFDAEVKESNAEDLTIVHFISTEKKDRGGDIMRADGMKIGGRPVVLFQHGRGPIGTEPIAKPVWIKKGTNAKGTKGVLAKTQFFPDDLGRRLWQKAADGYMPNWSIGYRTLKAQDIDNYTGRDVLEWELLEYSPVGVPMNPDAQGPVPGTKPKQDGDPEEGPDLGPVLFKMFPEDVLQKYGKAISALPAPELRGIAGDLEAFKAADDGSEPTHIRIVLGPNQNDFCQEDARPPAQSLKPKGLQLKMKGPADARKAREEAQAQGVGEGAGQDEKSSNAPDSAAQDGGNDADMDEKELEHAELWDPEEKPYPNEHACRLQDPKKFDRIRRENDKFGTGIHAIWGVKDNKASLQAIRFDSSKFTVDQANKWLKEHDHKCQEFEAASGKEEEDEKETLEQDIQALKATIDDLTVKIEALAKVLPDLPGSGKDDDQDGAEDDEKNQNPPDEGADIQKQAPRLVFKRDDPDEDRKQKETQKLILARMAKEVLERELVAQIRKMRGKVD